MEILPKIFWLFRSLTFLETGIWADRPNVVFILVDDMGYGDSNPDGSGTAVATLLAIGCLAVARGRSCRR